MAGAASRNGGPRPSVQGLPRGGEGVRPNSQGPPVGQRAAPEISPEISRAAASHPYHMYRIPPPLSPPHLCSCHACLTRPMGVSPFLSENSPKFWPTPGLAFGLGVSCVTPPPSPPDGPQAISQNFKEGKPASKKMLEKRQGIRG